MTVYLLCEWGEFLKQLLLHVWMVLVAKTNSLIFIYFVLLIVLWYKDFEYNKCKYNHSLSIIRVVCKIEGKIGPNLSRHLYHSRYPFSFRYWFLAVFLPYQLRLCINLLICVLFQYGEPIPRFIGWFRINVSFIIFLSL